MADIFISYARSTVKQAAQVAEALRALGYDVWSDDDLPAHRGYAEVIQERLASAKAVVVIWSAEAARSEWVQSEADRARAERKLVQLTIDGAPLPMPFDRIQCADLTGWTGDLGAPGWRKVVASIGELVRGAPAPVAAVASSPPPLPTKPSIAVLPFANLSGDPEQEYFADGMVVEIVEALSRIRAIFVIASGSGLSFKGKGISPQEAARKLGVRYVLEGSVRKAGGRVRIGVQLIDAADGAQIWTHRFEDTLEDVFALQDKVALTVAGKIEPAVQLADTRRSAARPTDNMGSYDLFLRAVPQYRRYDKAGAFAALDLVSRAAALDPVFGPALGMAAACHALINAYGWSNDRQSHRSEGVEMAHRALKAAGDDAYVLAYAALSLAMLEGDLDAGLTLIARAVNLNPGCSVAWFCFATLRLLAGETDLGIEAIETSVRLDPVGPNLASQNGVLGMARFRQRRFSEAVALLKGWDQQTQSPAACIYLAACWGHLGQIAEAREAIIRYRMLTPVPIDDYAQSSMRDPAQRKLFLDGIALAEGAGQVDAPADGAP